MTSPHLPESRRKLIAEASGGLIRLPRVILEDIDEARRIAANLSETARESGEELLTVAFEVLSGSLSSGNSMTALPADRQGTVFELLQQLTSFVGALALGREEQYEDALTEAVLAVRQAAGAETDEAEELPTDPQVRWLFDPQAYSRISTELLEIFSEEADDHLRGMYDALETLEDRPGDRGAFGDLRRSAHTLKGAAGAVGFEIVTAIAHRMEDVLDDLFESEREPTETLLGLMYQTTDVLHSLIERVDEQPEIQAAIDMLAAEYAQLGDVTAEMQPKQNAESDVTPSIPHFAPAVEIDLSEHRDEAVAESPTNAQVLRVPLPRVDDLARQVGELFINRSAFEQRLGDLNRFVEELQHTLARLRQVSHELETGFGVDLLGGGRFAAAPASDLPPGSRWSEFDELELDRYTEFHLLTRTLSEATSDLGTVGQGVAGIAGDFDGLLGRQLHLTRDVQDRLMRVRMVPFSTLTTRLQRTVRLVARERQRPIELSLEGEHVELDKTVLADIADPLLHLVRNAADHGIESPEERRRRDKPETGTVSVRAVSMGTQVVITVRDDGGGLDRERILQAAVSRGVLSSTEAATTSEDALSQLIFHPGLTTASTISEVSGRGVGMDIVRDHVHRLNGTLSVRSIAGEGTTFTVRLPMTLSVMRAVFVDVGRSMFAIPLTAIEQIQRVPAASVRTVGNDRFLRWEGETYRHIDLSSHLHPQRTDIPGQLEPHESSRPVLIVAGDERPFAISVDRVQSARDIVVKPLGNQLRNLPGVLGATLLGDGTAVPILNTAELREPPEQRWSRRRMRHAVEADRRTRVLVVDDSVSVRKVTTNLLTHSGMEAITARDGLDAWEQLSAAEVRPDVVLLDIEMPRMDGYELLSKLKTEPMFADVPVIMITSRAREKHREKAFALGAADYLVKPFQEEELLQRLREFSAVPH